MILDLCESRVVTPTTIVLYYSGVRFGVTAGEATTAEKMVDRKPKVIYCFWNNTFYTPKFLKRQQKYLSRCALAHYLSLVKSFHAAILLLRYMGQP